MSSAFPENSRQPLQWDGSRNGGIILRSNGENVSQNHYSTKPKRRAKNKKRKDPSAATMAKIRQREAAEKK
jgi:hypothetical protein